MFSILIDCHFTLMTVTHELILSIIAFKDSTSNTSHIRYNIVLPINTKYHVTVCRVYLSIQNGNATYYFSFKSEQTIQCQIIKRCSREQITSNRTLKFPCTLNKVFCSTKKYLKKIGLQFGLFDCYE